MNLSKAGAPALAIALLALSGGCRSNPFATGPLDTDVIASEDRLRRIQTLELARAPEREQAESLEEAAARFDQLMADFSDVENLDLTLAEVRAAAFEGNLDLKATLVGPTIAGERVAQEEGQFEALFTLNSTWSDTDEVTASALENGQSEFQSITPGLSVPLRTGGTLSVSAPISRFSTDNAFSTLNPAIRSDLEFSLSHNLLRGAGRRATMHQVRLAELDRQASESRTKLEVIRILANADRVYWRLYAAIRALEVVEAQYKVAIEQRDRAIRREKAGSGAEIDIVRAESGVADRAEQIIRAQNDLRLRERELKELINMPGLDVGTTTAVTPTSEPDPVEYEFDRQALLEAAVENRMELLELEIQLARDAAQIAFDENQSLPSLAMQYTYRLNGLGGSLSDSVSIAGQNEFEDWSVGLQAEIPLGNAVRKSALAQSILSRLQRLATRDARQQSIEREVLDAVDQLSTNWQRILASRQAVVLNARSLDAERRQFDVGRSTSTDVLDADARLADARLAEIRAVVEYQIAQIDLAVATGTLLGQARVEWGPSDPREGIEGTGVDERYRPASGVFVSP